MRISYLLPRKKECPSPNFPKCIYKYGTQRINKSKNHTIRKNKRIEEGMKDSLWITDTKAITGMKTSLIRKKPFLVTRTHGQESMAS